MRLLRILGIRKIVYFNGGIGDELLILRVLAGSKQKSVVLLLNNYNTLLGLIPKNVFAVDRSTRIINKLIILGENIPSAIKFVFPSYHDELVSISNDRHILEIIANKLEFPEVLITNPFPIKKRIEIIGIHSSGMHSTNYMNTKEWGINNFIEVSNYCLSRGVKILQFGSANDFPILGSIDARGQYGAELIKSVESCDLVICQVGFLMHLSNVLNVRCIVIYGGRENPKTTGYCQNINIVERPYCSFCWLENCINGNLCMISISPKLIISLLNDEFGI